MKKTWLVCRYTIGFWVGLVVDILKGFSSPKEQSNEQPSESFLSALAQSMALIVVVLVRTVMGLIAFFAICSIIAPLLAIVAVMLGVVPSWTYGGRYSLVFDEDNSKDPRAIYRIFRGDMDKKRCPPLEALTAYSEGNTKAESGSVIHRSKIMEHLRICEVCSGTSSLMRINPLG